MQCSDSSLRHTCSESQLHIVASLGDEAGGELQSGDSHLVAHTGQTVGLGAATLDHESTVEQGVVNTS